MKRNLFLGITCLLGLSAMAQQDPVLMRINGNPVLRSEFEVAYTKQKSLPGSGVPTPVGYAEQFVNLKLKVAAAQALGMDTTRAFRKELNDYRAQLAASYLTDKALAEADARQTYNKIKASPRAGRVLVMQLFTPLSQTLSAKHIHAAEVRMDSLYAVLKNSTDADFAAYVAKYSDDKQKSWIGYLQTPEEFENIVFSLPKGEVSRPFYTPQGLHIVKVLDRQEALPFGEVRDEKNRRLSYRPEVDKYTEALIQRLKTEYAYAPNESGVEELLSKGETTRPLFTLNGHSYSGNEFKRFAASYPRGVKKQLDAFVAKTILDTENARLEQKHPTLRLLIQEHRDSLLLAQITAREVGTKATTDEAGLSAYFQLHQSDYYWAQPRYRGVVLHGVDKKIVRQAKKRIKKLPPSEWAKVLRETFNTSSVENVKIEQGIFSEGDNKYVDKLVFKKGFFEPVASYPFTAVWGEKQKGPDSYKEVRKQLSADYQRFLDALWIKRLRTFGKVEINQEVLKTVNNH